MHLKLDLFGFRKVLIVFRVSKVNGKIGLELGIRGFWIGGKIDRVCFSLLIRLFLAAFIFCLSVVCKGLISHLFLFLWTTQKVNCF